MFRRLVKVIGKADYLTSEHEVTKESRGYRYEGLNGICYLVLKLGSDCEWIRYEIGQAPRACHDLGIAW